MQQQLTTEFIKSNCGCYTPDKLLKAFKENKNEECYATPTCISTLDELLNSNIPLKDKYWFICKKLATKKQNQQIAIGVAEIVLHIYEKKYPADKRLGEAVQAAKDYLNGIINIKELRIKRAAAYAADAAYADADAADAAYAATYAVAAAYAATRKPELQAVLLQYLKDFCRNVE